MQQGHRARTAWQLLVLFLVSLWCTAAAAQDKPWKDGTVWNVTLVKTKPGMGDVYLRDLAAHWKKIMDAAQKEGLIVSYKVLGGSASSRDDWDLMLLTESRNWAAFDNATEKWDALTAKVIGNQDAQQQMMVKRTEVREILGDKTLQEVVFK